MKKISFIVAAMVVAVGLLAGVTGAPASAAPYCGITWGSLPKVGGPETSPTVQLTNIRTGQHDCYDRMVMDMNGPAAGYDVQYVSNVYGDPTGQLIPLSGGAKLQVVLKAASYTMNGQSTYPGKMAKPLPGVNLAGYQTFRDAKFAGSFEGYTTVGLGVRAKLPFRVFKLDNRLVIDVAHRW